MRLEVLSSLPKKKITNPPLLFVHGAYHAAWCWDEFFLPFFSANDYPSYALSLRGHGKSEGRSKLHTFTLTDYVDDVLQVMHSISDQCILIGHSMGGVVVQKIAQQHKQNVHAAVLMASIPPQGMLRDFFWLSLTHFGTVMKLNSFNQGRQQAFPKELFFKGDDKHNAYVDYMQQESTKALLGLYGKIVKCSVNAEIPMCVLGSFNDRFVSEKSVRRTGAWYQTAPVMFSDIGHDMMLDSGWEKVAEHILGFIRSLEIGK
ncbi:alpha/beta hydrolase [Bacillus paralicheniformis]|uniref:alpha/beta hydrolase n=1 Tax=Bacillus paralicheniformis TaxID=1648923 RepID=UPI000D03742D|nr:alpha/beta hydrolase [Bacillus paralicheniformis]